MKILAVIFLGFFLGLCFRAVYLVVDAQQMNDQERAKLGLGPKGQGRK